jgi:hypothetical protein
LTSLTPAFLLIAESSLASEKKLIRLLKFSIVVKALSIVLFALSADPETTVRVTNVSMSALLF